MQMSSGFFGGLSHLCANMGETVAWMEFRVEGRKGEFHAIVHSVIVVSCFDSPEHYLPFLSGLARMYFELLGAADLSCRGGISRGRLFHDGHGVFGRGLVVLDSQRVLQTTEASRKIRSRNTK